MEKATEIFEKHWLKATGKPLDETTKHHMKYAIEAINEALLLDGIIQSLPSDEILIELAKNNCLLHQTSDDLGFLVTFDLNDLHQFCAKLLKGN